MKITIIIPVYNEEKTVLKVLDSIKKLNFKFKRINIKKEVLVIDDGSEDNSEKVIRDYVLKNKKEFRYIKKENGGKGSALRRGFIDADGDIIMIQDADLEYNPKDLKRLVVPILENKEVVVYGSRFLHKHKPKYRIYFLGNKFLSFLTKFLYGSKITDMETCYKLFKKEIIVDLNLKSNGFDIEPEITSKILRKGIRIKEMPIEYSPRSIEEGKKIGWKDGLKAIFVLFKNRFF